MLDLITGTPGAGKTLLAVHELYQAQQAGRLCFARVDGLSMPGVQPLVGSWRDCPDGSLIVVDECQELFGAGERAKVSDEDIYALERHRHHGLDLILISQDPRLLAGHVLRLVGRHRHLVRVMGSKQVRLYTMDSCADRLSKADLRASVMVLWRHPAYVFGFYKSATIHTRGSKPPALIWVVGAAVLGLSAFSVYGLQNFFVGNINEASAVSEKGTPRRSDSLPALVSPGRQPGHADLERVAVRDAELDAVLGCVVAGDVCRCWGEGHRTLKLTRADCLKTARAPIRSGAAYRAVLAYQERRYAKPARGDEERGTPEPAKPALEPMPKLAGRAQ